VTYAHVFPYSRRTGTTAAKLDGHLPAAVVRERAAALRRVCERKRAAFARRFDGAPAEILVETTRDPQTARLRGYTRSYLRAAFDGPDALMGRRVPAVLAVDARGRVGARLATPDDAAA
jgi:threonylcarbamoyladenosine tRNA methylthiotransferase MtaB